MGCRLQSPVPFLAPACGRTQLRPLARAREGSRVAHSHLHEPERPGGRRALSRAGEKERVRHTAPPGQAPSLHSRRSDRRVSKAPVQTVHQEEVSFSGTREGRAAH